MIELEFAGRWLAVLLVLGWLGGPLAKRLLPGLPDGAVCLARPLALLLVGYLAWLAAAARLLPFALAIWMVGLPVLASAAVATVLWPRWRRRATPAGPPIAGRGWFLVAHEALFVAVFAGFAWLRGYTPDITFTEKPMELMLLNSALRATSMPPEDGWLAGSGVNYYYLGYVLAALLTHLANVPVGYAFNLMLTTIVALAAATAFGLAANLWALHRAAPVADGGGEARPRLGWAAGAVGLLAAYLLVAAGNLVAGWRWLREPAATVEATWWGGIGWASSRVVIDHIGGGERPTINEFPWFSFILGDLHPHVLALPFCLLALGLALDWWRWSPAAGVVKRDHLAIARLVTGGLVVGALYALNSWDFPLYLLLAGLALTRPAWSGPPADRLPWRSAGLAAAGLAGLSVLLLLPFYLSFTSFAGNSGVRLPAPADRLPLLAGLARTVGTVTWERTNLGEFLQVYGFLALAAAAWLLALASRGLGLPRNLVGLGLIGMALAGVVLGSAPVALAGGLVLLALLVWQWGRLSPAEGFVCLLAAVGLGLPVAAEFFFLQDVFADRMNTVFKSYYQSWTLLSLVAALGTGAAVGLAVDAWRRPTAAARRLVVSAGGGLVLLTLLLTLGYPLIATPARADSFAQRRGLDGLGYLANQPDEQAALAWVMTHVPPGTIMAEDPGHSYGEYFGLPHVRAATIAGTVAPLGWPGHEQQWRANQPAQLNEVTTRLRDMQDLYGTTDVASARRILDRYRIEYVYVGVWERQADARQRARQPVYSPAALAKFDAFMEVAFQRGQVTIYRRRAMAGG